MIRNVAGQIAGGQVINAVSGAGFIGTVTVYVTGDGGTQALGEVGSGICTHEGNGYYTYTPSQAETNYASVAFTFIGSGAVPSSTTYDTLTIEQSASINVASSGVAVSALDLITKSYRRIGVVGGGQTLSSEDASDGLSLLNAMLDSFATERLMVPSISRSTWTLVSGTAAYTVGTGGDVDIARPVFVADIKFIDTSMSTPMEMPLAMLTDQAYANVPMKTATSLYPSGYYWNPTFTGTGLGTITFVPVPTSATLQGVIYAPTALTQVASLNTTLVLQPGYRWFLQEQLAVFAGPEYGVSVPPELRESARDAKANIKRANIRLVELGTLEGAILTGGGAYSIWTDH